MQGPGAEGDAQPRGGLSTVLVDDHPVVRAGLRAMLSEDPRIRVVAEAADGKAALDVVARLVTEGRGPDLVLMDLQMGEGMDGVAATRQLRRQCPSLPVLILTTYDTEADILAAVEAGASGYMLKDAAPEDIHRAVHDAAAGLTALAPAVAARLIGRTRGENISLSTREVELLELLATGLSNQQIARQLFISVATVKTHLVHIYQKLGADNRTAAVRVASERGIIRA
ncbi:response regulator transcription factor [Nesterenkonia sp. HG001]|uniref:response regulator transcription factor n=1 Tax=Nesterenkonia sp. HG001 TaxID=2983207 RepID=UPI002AC55541|nr:response regulator transcription factor [Nesterenkonia sp. HG001]MDZ5079135.1 response regulator transcription factor [Nesterenkonia sp. HG001]